MPKKTIGLAVGLSLLAGIWPTGGEAAATTPSPYAFDGKMPQDTLNRYLSRSAQIMDMFWFDTDAGKKQEWLRFVQNTGTKLIGRAAMIWTNFQDDETMFYHAGRMAAAVHAQDPEVILQAAIFETTAQAVNQIPIPAWVFEEFGLQPTTRNFSYASMLYQDGRYSDFWGAGQSVPDITSLETQMFFFYRAKRFIDLGYESIHYGQVKLMGEADPFYLNWNRLLNRVRAYGEVHARRHNVLLDAHVNEVYDNANPLWYTAKGQFRYETPGDTGNYYNGDASRLNRADGAQSADGHYIVYKLENATGFEILSANWAGAGDQPDGFDLYASPDGRIWTPVGKTIQEIQRTENTWPNYKTTNGSPLPAGTNYVKISWKTMPYIWTVQLLDVKINAAGAALHDPLEQSAPAVKKLAFDFVGFPARLKGIPNFPQETKLEVNYLDGLYQKTIGGLNPQGWVTPRSPYLIELDNYGGSNGSPGIDSPYWPWGYDEIAWFAHQNDDYRHSWLKYAYDWFRTNDSYGHLQLPAYRTLGNSPVNGSNNYNAITASAVFPNTLGDEEAIKAIWGDAPQSGAVEDDLRDLTKIYRFSSQLTKDGSNPGSYGGDGTRLTRTSNTSEYVIYKAPYATDRTRLTGFAVETWFSSAAPVADFKFYLSSDDVNYTLYTPKKKTVNGNMKKITYMGSRLPVGTRYVKVEFNNASSSASNSQIGKVSTFYADSSVNAAGKIDDFESYGGSDLVLNAAYEVNPNTDPVTISLDSTNKNEGDFGMKYEYNVGVVTYGGIALSLGNADWSDYDALRFWFEPDGSNRNLTIQIQTASGDYWDKVLDLSDPTARVIEIPFSAFARPSWHNGTGPMNLSSVSQLSLYAGVGAGSPGSGTLYFDSIELTKN
ncbi:carbohydrate binding domain-containing protein [Cohnella herbarum]|uniref:CBM11 domain-containing protein n=1 Tax=Cohnella herbarum TaxID=2728023 RepID=A0A7Z2VP05_9BACL|nr:carbohydrate binding domain-containing protein [Cohnella herbarum]QJD86861.1 hypothetical protein HH215_29265 [Cohnella herbarum]